VDCYPGSYSGDGADTCLACEPGTFAPIVAAPSCAPCDPGQSSGYGFGVCYDCWAGTFATNPGSPSCSPCEASTWSADKAATCTPCGECPSGGVCQVATCDPAQGCTLVPATDGTPCGDGAACVSGVCAGEWLWREQVSTCRGTYRDLTYHTSTGRCVNQVGIFTLTCTRAVECACQIAQLLYRCRTYITCT
jgi:hypothetical protein